MMCLQRWHDEQTCAGGTLRVRRRCVMNLTITINMDGAAFDNDRRSETVKLLEAMVWLVRHAPDDFGKYSGGSDLVDSNNRVCGYWELTA